MPLHPLYAKGVLDWLFIGSAFPQPAQRWISWATGSPNSAGASDGAASRKTVTFSAAFSPVCSLWNNAANTGGTVGGAAAQTYVAWNLYDGSSGNRIVWGTFSAGLGCRSIDQPALAAAGSLSITIS